MQVCIKVIKHHFFFPIAHQLVNNSLLIFFQEKHDENDLPAAQSQYLEWVYLGGNTNVIPGIAIHGINWNIMYNLISLHVLQPTSKNHG